LGVVILSVSLFVCPSDTRVDCDKTKCCTADILYTTRKGYRSATVIPTMVGEQRPFPLKFALKVTHPFVKRRRRPISAYKVIIVRDNENSSVMTNIKLTVYLVVDMDFTTSYR